MWRMRSRWKLPKPRLSSQRGDLQLSQPQCVSTALTNLQTLAVMVSRLSISSRSHSLPPPFFSRCAAISSMVLAYFCVCGAVPAYTLPYFEVFGERLPQPSEELLPGGSSQRVPVDWRVHWVREGVVRQEAAFEGGVEVAHEWRGRRFDDDRQFLEGAGCCGRYISEKAARAWPASNILQYNTNMSEKALKEENDRLLQQLRRLQEEHEAELHDHKKSLLESKTKLDFQTNRADEYEQKYKSILQYKNQEESLLQLDAKLRDKEDEIVRLLSLEHEKTQQAQQLFEEMEELRRENNALNSDLNQIKEAALNAIMDKDASINELNERLEELQHNESVNELKSAIIELEDKYRELEERSENGKTELTALLEEKDAEINDLQERMALIKDKHEERSSRLEQEIMDLERHLEEVTALKDHEENLEEKYYHTEEKLRKAEKRLFELEQLHQDTLAEKEQALQKLEAENETLKSGSEQLKELRVKFREMDREIFSKRRELDEVREKLERSTLELTKKVSHLESEKKILSDNVNLKQQEVDRLKADQDTPKSNDTPTLARQKSIGAISPQKPRDQDTQYIEKLKKQNKDLEETNEALKRKVEEQTKQLQEGRQKLLQARGSEGANSEANKLRVQIEDLTSYLKKVENEMLMKKITHAEDENYWSLKEKKYKNDFEELNKKYKRESSELLERIDRIKKLVPKDKKTDYYQSGFK